MFGSDAFQSPDYGRIVNRAHFDRLMSLIEPHSVISGGHSRAPDLYIAPTLLYPVTADSPAMQSEIFGPLLPIMEVRDLDDAIMRVQAGPKPLAAYLFSNSKSAHRQIVEHLSAGSVCINDVMVFMAVDGLPFGGVGASGNGNYKGHAGFRQLSHNKAVLKRSFWPDLKIRYAPMTKNKIKWLRKFR
jgi:acyl-CoA reductase-like NAD-dependent aldehyde dehydrogenase